ncbi:MAG TPA: hypothetical protein PK736_05780 [Bacteroidia bacterium]|nr:hypothetical protein [Bacteroidia bacterium]
MAKRSGDEIMQKIEEINLLLKSYDTLSPFSENEDRFELIDSIGNRITAQLLVLLNDKRIVNYPIETLLFEEGIFISKSNDNKIFFFSIDEKTGGSYRTNITIIHYRLSDGMVHAEFFGSEDYEAMATSIYDKVFLVDSAAQKYFVIGSVQTCNTCLASLAIAITLDTSSYHVDLIAEFDGRQDDLKIFEFDSLEKIFSYEYFAASNDDSIYGGDNEMDGLQHKYKNKYKYLNGAFFQIEKCEMWDNKE